MNEYENETIEKKINDLIEISSNSKDELIVNMSTKFLKFQIYICLGVLKRGPPMYL
jgi:hypothetical protein